VGYAGSAVYLAEQAVWSNTPPTNASEEYRDERYAGIDREVLRRWVDASGFSVAVWEVEKLVASDGGAEKRREAERRAEKVLLFGGTTTTAAKL
jgi:hypothetical protein